MIVLSCGAASYLFAIAVTKDIKCILNTINENSKTKMGRKRIYKQLNEFIGLHSTLKQLS